MARRKVEQVKCDRCGRVDLKPVPDTPKETVDFEASFGDQRLVYEDICPRCTDTIKNLWESLKEWQRSLGQTLIGSEEAPPMTVAPDYTPPKPHSTASTQR